MVETEFQDGAGFAIMPSEYVKHAVFQIWTRILVVSASIGTRFSVGWRRRYARNIYNTEDKLYILKLNSFQPFPGKLFMSTIVKRDFMHVEILHNSQ